MNRVSLMGRLTKDPDIYVSKGDNPITVAKYSLAVAKAHKKDEADFIQVVSFEKRAEFCEKYLKKGMMMGVSGHIQTGSYVDKEGNKRYTVDIIAEDHYFCASKKKENQEEALEAEEILEPAIF